MNKTILWQKWVNPYELPTDDGKLLENLSEEDLDDTTHWETYGEEEIEESAEELLDASISKINTKAMITPMGMIPLNEKQACTKTFKFWIGHTNFTLCEECKDSIENTDGVEILDIFTRYRFRVAVGKAFQDRNVMQDIQKNLYEKLK